MKKYIKEFFKIGLMASGGGPLIVAIVYVCLFASGVVSTVGVKEYVLGIMSSLLLAFIAGGICVVYQIEKLPLMWSTLIHSSVLYFDYIVIYLINGWLDFNFIAILLFTLIFIVVYFIIWSTTYFSIKMNVRKLNKKIG